MTSNQYIDLREGPLPVPSFPSVVAEVREDGSGEVTINGASYEVDEVDMPAARAATIGLIVDNAAARVNRPLRVEISDPAGAWVLRVHPDGRVEELEVIPSAAPSHGGHTGGLADLVLVRSDDDADTDPDDALLDERDVLDGAVDVPPGRTPRADDVATTGRVDPVPTPVDDAADAAPSVTEAPPTVAAAEPVRVASSEGTALRPRTRREVRQAPTLTDLIATRPQEQDGPAEQGWQAGLRRVTGGLVRPGPGAREREHRRAVTVVQKGLDGPKTIVVVNPKGGGTKTTSAILLAATFGRHRGGYTLAWDNNETRGTLGWRAQQAQHHRTAVDLLRDLDRFSDSRRARVGDLDSYVRSQGDAQFDVLASDEDAASAASIDDEAFGRLHATLSRFYRVIVVDTGNNMRASNWSAAVEAADQLVIVSTIREDTAQSAAWLVDALRATGRAEAVENAVTVLAAPSRTVDDGLRSRLHDHFRQLTRSVLEVPHDEQLVSGGPIRVDTLAPATREAWLRVSASVADGL